MKFLKALKWHALLKGIMYIAVGVVAFVIPETMMETLGYLMGIILIVIGLISILSYLFKDPLQNYYHDDFTYGMGEILIGILILFHVDWIIKLVPVLLGALVLISGFSKFQDVVDMKRLKYDSWIFMLVLAGVNIAVGILLIANPFEAVELFFKVLGCALIFSGVTDCISVVFFAAKLKKIQQEQKAVTAQAVEITGEAAEPGVKAAESMTADRATAAGDPEGEDL